MPSVAHHFLIDQALHSRTANYHIMTSFAFLSFAFVSITAALPAAQNLQVETWSTEDTLSTPSSSCRSGHTICVDIYNGCGFKTGG